MVPALSAPMLFLSMTPVFSLPSWIMTYASNWHASSSHLGQCLQTLALVTKLKSLGRKRLNMSFPDQRGSGFSTVGSGRGPA